MLIDPVWQIHMQKPEKAVAVVEVPNNLPITIQRHRREHQRRLDACNCVKRIRRPASQQPSRQKLARAEGKEVP